ncbi:MAG: hypothetical protein AAF975_06895, partial [Spirochaetota bacterium]
AGLCGCVWLLFSQPYLQAQYPSASYRTADTPMLGEFQSRVPPTYNPAFLGFGRDALRPDLSRRFHLRLLDMMTSYDLLAMVFVTDAPSLEDELNSRIGELIKGLSVNFTDLSSRSQMYRDALTSYVRDLNNNVVPPLVTTATTPPLGLSRPEIEASGEYIRYKNRMEGDATTLLNNLGKVLGGIGVDYLKKQSFFNSSFYLQLFDVEFLLGQQVALGFGVNIRAHIHAKDDFSGFTIDVNRLDLPKMSLNGIPLPSGTEWRSLPAVAEARLRAVLGLATGNYIQNLATSLDQNALGSLILRSMFEQSYIDLYHVVEPNLRLAFGFPLTSWLYVGNRFQAQFLWGMDNIMVAPDVLDLSRPIKLAGFVYNPFNYQVSIHAGWDVSFLVQPFDWWVFSFMVTDLVGFAPGRIKTSRTYWGDLYYPIDLQVGTFFQFRLGADVRLGFGADIYELMGMAFKRRQRFNPVLDYGSFVNHIRGKFYFDYLGQFRLAAHYWSRSFGVALRFDFLTFHPGVGVEVDFDLKDIRIRLDIFHFTN